MRTPKPLYQDLSNKAFRLAHSLYGPICASILIIGLLFPSCSGDGGADNSTQIAKYKDKILTEYQLRHFIPNEAKGEDSVRFAEHYIRQWVKEQVMSDAAIQADKKLKDRIEFKVEDYRMKLIMHEFSTSLIKDSLDTKVSEDEITKYYQKNKEHFTSTEPQYSYFYVKATNTDTKTSFSWLKTNTVEDLGKLRNWAETYALDFKLDSSFTSAAQIEGVSVGYFGDLKSSPVGKLIRWDGVIQGQRRKYMFKMLQIVQRGEVLPLRLARDNIRSIILNERKMKLIEKTEERIIKDANLKGDIISKHVEFN